MSQKILAKNEKRQFCAKQKKNAGDVIPIFKLFIENCFTKIISSAMSREYV